MKNYYVILGISRGANLNQIKKAYRRIAKKYHPDTTQSVDSQQFREIKEAYEALFIVQFATAMGISARKGSFP